jgi:transketolase
LPTGLWFTIAPMPTTVSPTDVRRLVLEQAHRAGVGHIGSALSVVELLVALSRVLRGEPDDPDRDRFVLSKGHAALALYAVLHLEGRLSREQLESYCGDGTFLGTHPEHELPGVDFSSGSLGHGLPLGAGAALAARLQGSRRRAFVLVSDAECNEGSLWEAVMFAAHHRLGNLVAVVDANGQQALGYTREVLDLEPLGERFAAFGWEAVEVDGHDVDALVAAFDRDGERPRAVIARTTFGKGVSYMESLVKWHYWPMSDDDYERALGEVSA